MVATNPFLLRNPYVSYIAHIFYTYPICGDSVGAAVVATNPFLLRNKQLQEFKKALEAYGSHP